MKIRVKGLTVYSAGFRPMQQSGVGIGGRGVCAGTLYGGPTVRVALVRACRARGSALRGQVSSSGGATLILLESQVQVEPE